MKKPQHSSDFEDAGWDGGTPSAGAGHEGFGGAPSSDTSWDGSAQPASGPARGPWHILLTILCLVMTMAASELITLATKDVVGIRPWWMLGLIFMVPATTVLLTAYAVESATSAMTPRFNRKPQMLVVLIASVLSFVLGTFGAATKIEASVAVAPPPPPVRYLVLVDRSDSMGWNDPSNRCADAVAGMLSAIPDSSDFGLVLYSHEVLDSVPVLPLNQAHRDRILALLATPPSGGTDFDLVITHAFQLLGNSPVPGMKQKIILITDGEDIVDQAQDYIAKSQNQEASISIVKIDGQMDPSLTDLVAKTGGQAVTVATAADLTEKLQGMVEVDGEATPLDLLKMERQGTALAPIVLLLLEGILLGLALTLMLSRQGQKRFQLILSPLMGIAAGFIIQLPNPTMTYDLRQAIAFALFGVVLMRKNIAGPRRVSQAAPAAPKSDSFDF